VTCYTVADGCGLHPSAQIRQRKGIFMNATVRVLLAGVMCAWVGLVPTNAATTARPTAQGYWVGTLTESSQDLHVRFRFGQLPAGKWSGNFSADSQAVMDYPFDSVRVQGSRIDAVLGSGALVLSGTVGSQAIVGTFSGAQGTGSLSLVRSAPPRFPYSAQNIVFHNGGTSLAGSLYVPRTAGRHPAVVLLHGSGCQTRWGTLRFIADQLARQGVAAFIYDKRGCGESRGSWQTVGYPVLADDAIAAIEVLQHRKDIEPSKIGIWGHSEGGNITPLIATRSSHVAFIVAADAPAMVVHDQDIFRFRNELRDAGGTAQGNAAALALYKQFDDVARSGQGYA
jgi:dipeptidyl aminopeptidase/acylaminoacyl peptidase